VSGARAARYGVGLLGISSQYRPVAVAEKHDLIRFLLEARPDFMDTATGYGQDTARINPILGRCLAEHAGPAPAIVNKIGAALCDGDDLGARAVAEFERGLDELGVEVVDTTLVHRAALRWLPRDARLHEAVRRSGRSRRFGLCTNDPAVLAAYCDAMQVDVLQAAVNLLDYTAARPVLEVARARGIAVQARSVAATGLLSGSYAAEDVDAFADERRRFAATAAARAAFRARIAVVERIREHCAALRVAGQFDGSLVDFCYSAIAASPCVGEVILGGSTREQLAQNLALRARPFPDELAAQIFASRVDEWAAPYA